jgi:RNA polymerase primary sigma factor
MDLAFDEWTEERRGGVALGEETQALPQADELPEEEDVPSHAGRPAPGAAASADDALGLYLQQMGTIPLLSRPQELELTQRLEVLRRRYRHAVLFSWDSIARVVGTFERVQAGKAVLDRLVDVVASLGLTADSIRERLPLNLAQLRRLLEEARAEFPRQAAAGGLRRPSEWSRLRQAVRLAEELSPRTELLDTWADEQRQQADRVKALVRQGSTGALRDVLFQVLATPEELARLSAVVQHRRARYQKARAAGGGQPAAGGVDCQEVPRPRAVLR